MINPKITDKTTAGSTCFFAVGIAATAGGSGAVECAAAICSVDGVTDLVLMIVVATVVPTVARVCCITVTVVGAVVATVAKSCCTMVTVTSALVTVLMSVTETVTNVVNIDGFTFLSLADSAPAALGTGVPFAAPAALDVGESLWRSVTFGVGMSLAIPGTLGVGRSLPTTGILGVGMSLPAAGTLGAAASCPAPLSFPFLGDMTDPKDPRIERGKSLIVADC